MKVALIDIDAWESAAYQPAVSERELIAVINAWLEECGSACVIHALRYTNAKGRNWEVAAFELRGVATGDLDAHLQQIGQLIAAATEGYMVDWPSVALH
jgi:hypothetical protein